MTMRTHHFYLFSHCRSTRHINYNDYPSCTCHVLIYTIYQQEEPKPVNKKLRLTYPAPKPQESPINLTECTTPSEICSQLISLRSLLPVSAEVADTLIGQIKTYYYPDQDEMVKSLIIALMGELGRLPNVASSYVCDELVNWVKEECK